MSNDNLEMYGQLIVDGLAFSPRRAEQQCDISFSEKNEVGDIALLGRHRDKPLPYGSGVLEFSLDHREGLLRKPGIIDELRRLGATNLTIVINVAHGSQCNFELDSQTVTALGCLGLTIGITCYPKVTPSTD